MLTTKYVKDLNSRIRTKRNRRTALFVQKMEMLEESIEKCTSEEEEEILEKERSINEEIHELSEDITLMTMMENFILTKCEIWDIEV